MTSTICQLQLQLHKAEPEKIDIQIAGSCTSTSSTTKWLTII